MTTMADALRTLYIDRMTVRRVSVSTSDYGAEQETLTRVYEDVPCRISFTGTPVQTETAIPDLAYSVKLIYDTTYTILPGDHVCATRGARIYDGVAGESAVYPSHRETPVAIHKRGG